MQGCALPDTRLFIVQTEDGVCRQPESIRIAHAPPSPAVRQPIADQSTATDSAVYRIYDAIVDRTIPQDPNLPNDQEFVNELEVIGQQVAYEESTVEEAAEDLQALIERLAVK